MASAIILAGGQSRRMGQDKASTLLLGKPLLQHVIDRVAPYVDEVVIVTRPRQSLSGISWLPPKAEGLPRPVIVVEDMFPGKGPLGGLFTGLSVVTSFPALAVACDMPLLQPSVVEALLSRADGCHAVVPLHDGLPEPLCAAYHHACLASLRLRLDRGQLAMREWLDEVHTRYFAEADWLALDPAAYSFFNVNTPDDLQRAEGILRGT